MYVRGEVCVRSNSVPLGGDSTLLPCITSFYRRHTLLQGNATAMPDSPGSPYSSSQARSPSTSTPSAQHAPHDDGAAAEGEGATADSTFLTTTVDGDAVTDVPLDDQTQADANDGYAAPHSTKTTPPPLPSPTSHRNGTLQTAEYDPARIVIGHADIQRAAPSTERMGRGATSGDDAVAGAETEIERAKKLRLQAICLRQSKHVRYFHLF
jgi:hypothetical protein